MDLTCNDLFNYLRCTRFAALDRERRKHGTHQDIAQDRYITGANEFNDADFFDDYPMRELPRLKALFSQLFLPGLNVEEQRSFYQTFSHGISLKTTADFIVRDDNHGDIYTVVPVSSDIFLRFRHTKSDGNKETLFVPDDDNRYRLIAETMDSRNYTDKMKQMTDRHKQTGRLLFDQSFRKYIIDRQNDGTSYNYHLVMVNPNYIHDGNKISSDFFVVFDFTDVAERLSDRLNTGLYRMLNHIELNDESRCPLVRKECMPGTVFSCPFVPYCYAHVPDVHPVTAYFNEEEGFIEETDGKPHKYDTFELLNEGIVHMLDVPISWLHREKNLMQRYCVDNNYIYANKQKITLRLETLKEPLVYLDVGSIPQVIPSYKQERSFMQHPYWFAVYKEQKNDQTSPEIISHTVNEHSEQVFRGWVNHLIEALKDHEGHVIVFGAGRIDAVIQQLIHHFPEYSDALKNVIDRLFDFKRVLKNDASFYLSKGLSHQKANTYNFYHPDLDGSYAFEHILSVFDIDLFGDGTIKHVTEAKRAARLMAASIDDKQCAIYEKRLKTYSENTVRSMHAIKRETVRLTKDK